MVTATSAADTTQSASATVTVQTSPVPVGISISPTRASLPTGGSQQFTATVTSTSNTSVTWAASGGTVSSKGLYTAPSSAGTYTVTATSVADTTKSASATVTVSARVRKYFDQSDNGIDSNGCDAAVHGERYRKYEQNSNVDGEWRQRVEFGFVHGSDYRWYIYGNCDQYGRYEQESFIVGHCECGNTSVCECNNQSERHFGSAEWNDDVYGDGEQHKQYGGDMDGDGRDDLRNEQHDHLHGASQHR